MKNKLLSGVFIFLLCNLLHSNQTFGQGKLEGRLSLSGAFALYPMAVKWQRSSKKLILLSKLIFQPEELARG